MPPKLAFSNSEQGGEFGAETELRIKFGAQGADRCGGRTGCVRRCLVVFSCPSAAEHAGAVMRGAGGQRRARKGEAGRPSRAGLVHCTVHHPELDYQNALYCPFCRKVISYLPGPITTIGCARETHLAKTSPKRSERVPTCDMLHVLPAPNLKPWAPN